MKFRSDIRSVMRFDGWRATARNGAVARYHVGLLMDDRLTAPALDRLADHVGLSADCGRVHMTQRRRDDGLTDYLVVQIRPPVRVFTGRKRKSVPAVT